MFYEGHMSNSKLFSDYLLLCIPDLPASLIIHEPDTLYRLYGSA